MKKKIISPFFLPPSRLLTLLSLAFQQFRISLEHYYYYEWDDFILSFRHSVDGSPLSQLHSIAAHQLHSYVHTHFHNIPVHWSSVRLPLILSFCINVDPWYSFTYGEGWDIISSIKLFSSYFIPKWRKINNIIFVLWLRGPAGCWKA